MIADMACFISDHLKLSIYLLIWLVLSSYVVRPQLIFWRNEIIVIVSVAVYLPNSKRTQPKKHVFITVLKVKYNKSENNDQANLYNVNCWLYVFIVL